MTLIEGFRDDAFDNERFERWMIVAVGMAGVSIVAEVMNKRTRNSGWVGWTVCAVVCCFAIFSTLILGYIGYSRLFEIPGVSAFEYCIEMRSPVNFAENCPGTGLPQDYFFRSDGSGDKSGRDRNNSKPSTQWLALSSSIVGLIFATIGAIFVFVFACVAHDDEDFSFGFFALCSVVSWVILYVICMVRTLTVLEDAWPKNGCYIAICTRHGDDDFGTAKTSLSPSDLREAWEGGTDRMFDAMALVVVVFLYVMLTALIRWCGEFVRAKSNHDITREAEARQNARRVVSYQSEPEVFVGRAELPPPPPEAPPPPYSTANYDPPVGLLDEFVVHQGPAVAGSDGKFYDEPEPQRNRSTCV